MIRKNIYKWHRSLSIVIAVPVLLWALSGFMHPVMTNIRPEVTTQTISFPVLDSNRIKVPLQEALVKNHIGSFTAFQLVAIDTNWFYQVQTNDHAEPVYLSSANGSLLTAGNWLYAQYLARIFLEGDKKNPVSVSKAAGDHKDCCDAATDCVLNTAGNTKVESVSYITSFTDEYKSINHLLPVYRVAFTRADGIRIYVEPTQNRFAFAMDDKRWMFDRIFTLIHTWQWLSFLGKGKLLVECILAAMAFLTTMMGICIFFITKSKKGSRSTLVRTRRNHRYVAMLVSLFTLMFTFSGAYHALTKFSKPLTGARQVLHTFHTAAVDLDLRVIQRMVKTPVTNISMIHMNGNDYWRVMTRPVPDGHRRDLMKDEKQPVMQPVYVNTHDLSIVADGEQAYARFLASQFSGFPDSVVQQAKYITRFNNEYNFADKRLPVWEISYHNSHEHVYVETGSGILAKQVGDGDLTEGYSFAFFHKHEFMSWGGKGLKDVSTMFWAMAQVAMVITGLLLYFKHRKKRQ